MEKITVLNFLLASGLNDWPDERFCLFIERIVHPEVQKPDIQEKMVTDINLFLAQDGFELHHFDSQGGLPVYRVQRNRIGVDGKPKYTIFASSGLKPDIVIADAVNMDIQIVRYADKCLIYDEPPPKGDLTWEMLVGWWAKKRSRPDSSELRRELGNRLQASLQSEPERMMFSPYFKFLKPKYGVNLPALLPQVYLHYDPRNRNEREQPALVRQRMDFLLLLKNAVRVVIEIDGVQHYSDNEQRASPRLYAEMVAEDRRIKNLGYDVYRFGGVEFTDNECAKETVVSFFEHLFSRHGIMPVE